MGEEVSYLTYNSEKHKKKLSALTVFTASAIAFFLNTILCKCKFSFQNSNLIAILIWTVVFQVRDVEHDWVVDICIRIFIAIHSILWNCERKAIGICLTFFDLAFYNLSMFVSRILFNGCKAPFLFAFLAIAERSLEFTTW